MLKIKFKIDKEIIARSLFYRNKLMPGNLSRYLWNKYEDSYKLLKRQGFKANIEDGILKELQQLPYFLGTLKECKINNKRIKREWSKNKDKINKFLERIMKIKFDLKVTAYILPSITALGSSNAEKHHIYWGVDSILYGKDYDLVYLVHESLHSFFGRGENKAHNDINHTIIENIADIELYKFLTKQHNPYQTLHPYLVDLHKRMLPYWNLYLNKSREEIEKIQEIEDCKYNIDEFEPLRNEYSSLNINEFYEKMKEMFDNRESNDKFTRK